MWYSILGYIKNSYIFAKFISELIALAVKGSWVGFDRHSFMLIFHADDLGLQQCYKQS